MSKKLTLPGGSADRLPPPKVESTVLSGRTLYNQTCSVRAKMNGQVALMVEPSVSGIPKGVAVTVVGLPSSVKVGALTSRCLLTVPLVR